jgi:hypothetical protein
MKYLLTVFIAHQNQDLFAQSVAMEISQLTKVNGVKYHYGPQAVIYTFETKSKFETVKSFFDTILGDLSITHILVPIKTDKMSYWFEKQFEKHLFGTDICKSNEEYSKEEQEMLQDQMFGGRNIFNDIDDEEDEDEDEIGKIIQKTMKKEKETPSLDDLLDKINKSGFTSLTQTEKNLLKQYSN